MFNPMTSESQQQVEDISESLTEMAEQLDDIQSEQANGDLPPAAVAYNQRQLKNHMNTAKAILDNLTAMQS